MAGEAAVFFHKEKTLYFVRCFLEMLPECRDGWGPLG